MKKPPIRFWIATMVFMTVFTNYMIRANLSISIIAMLKRKNTTVPYCLKQQGINQTEIYLIKEKQFDWSPMTQQQMLGAYYYGYVPISFLTGAIMEHIGPTRVILYSSAMAVVLNSLTPLCASWSWIAVIVIRILIGMTGGAGYPGVNNLIASWAPPNEKGKFLAAMMGNTLGTVISFNVVGMVTAMFGWPWGFHATSLIVAIFCIVFWFLVSDGPTNHKWVTDEEKNYILEAQAGTVSTVKKMPPYLKIFSSCPFWGLTAAQFGNLWSLFLTMEYVPMFLAQTVGFNLKSSAFLASLPYMCRLIFSNIFGAIMDYVRTKNYVRLVYIRKGMIIVSHFLPAASLFLMSAAGCHSIPIVVLIMLTQLFNGAVVVSHLQNPQDLAPNYAGTVYGVMNGLATNTGFLVTWVNGIVMTYIYPEQTLDGPHLIFIIGGLIISILGLMFMIFGSVEIQPWNEKPAATEADK